MSQDHGPPTSSQHATVVVRTAKRRWWLRNEQNGANLRAYGVVSVQDWVTRNPHLAAPRAGEAFTVTWSVINAGDRVAAVHEDALLIIGAGDACIHEQWTASAPPLAPGATYLNGVRIGRGLPAGLYHLSVWINSNRAAHETSYDDNEISLRGVRILAGDDMRQLSGSGAVNAVRRGPAHSTR